MATSKKKTGGSAAKKTPAKASSTAKKSTSAKPSAAKSATPKSAPKSTPANTEKKTATKTGAKATAVPEVKPAVKRGAGLSLHPELGKISGVVNALAGVKARADKAGVDYIGALKDSAFVPVAVTVTEDESVRTVLARLGALPKATKKEASIAPENLNNAPSPKAKKKPLEDEFLKRKSSFSEDSTEIPKDFSPLFVIGRGKPEKTGFPIKCEIKGI